MTFNNSQPALEQIHLCFQDAISKQPAYQNILPFFETLFTLQEAAVGVTHPESLPMDTKLVQARIKGEMPLMDRRQVPLDAPAALHLLHEVCTQAGTANPDLAEAANVLLHSMDSEKASVEKGFGMLMNDDQEGLADLAQTLGMDRAILIFFLNASIWPSISQHERRFSAQKEATAEWSKGYCPICGDTPGISFLNEEGLRYLVCGFCRHQWEVKRIQCPFCDNNNTETLSYFFSEEEKAYRVYTCDHCRKYIKTVDTRQLTRSFYAPLETILTTHLDIKAEQMGYQSGAPTGLLV